MQRLDRFPVTRIVATAGALDAMKLPANALAMRTAPDELLVLGLPAPPMLTDGFAIIVDDTSFMGAWLDVDVAKIWLAHHCEWELPAQRPVFAQGEIAGLPVKLWLEARRMLVLVQQPYAFELGERLA